MKKVIVIGSSGAGKTTFAQALAKSLGVEHIELDSLYHLEDWKSIEPDEFRKVVFKKAKADGWVFCGNYFSTLGIEFFKKADTIIWLDYSFPLVLARLLRRTFVRMATRQELWNGNRERPSTLLTKDSLIIWMMKSWNKLQRRYGPLFESGIPGVEMIRMKTPAQTASFLKRQLSKRR